MTDIENINESIFESIKHINEHGQEYWTARELQPVLEYTKWENFKVAITRAMEACKSSKIKDSDHFAEVRKMVTIGSGAKRELEDYHLSRYACYLIAMNGDPRKKAIALARSTCPKTKRQRFTICTCLP